MTALIALEHPGCATLRVPVLKVFDGDGFLTKVRSPRNGGEFELPVRFGFIDAPEMGQPGGSEAKEFLTSLIAGKSVDLVILTKMDTGGSFDRHGRIVCVPYLIEDTAHHGDHDAAVAHFRPRIPIRSLSRNLELEMVLNGWAWVLTRYGPDPSYLEALRDARSNRRGIWSRDDNEHPWEFKRRRYRAGRGRPDSSAHQGHQEIPSQPASCGIPSCTGHLVQRSGRFGPFYGCSKFPHCRYTTSTPHRASTAGT